MTHRGLAAFDTPCFTLAHLTVTGSDLRRYCDRQLSGIGTDVVRVAIEDLDVIATSCPAERRLRLRMSTEELSVEVRAASQRAPVAASVLRSQSSPSESRIDVITARHMSTSSCCPRWRPSASRAMAA